MEAFAFPVGGDVARTLSIWEKRQSACRTFGDTSRFFTTIDPLNAEAAFPHHMLSGAELGHMKRAGLDAVAAPDTSALDMLYHPVGSSEESSRRTCGNASRIVAVETRSRYGKHAAGGEFPRNMALDAAQRYTRRRVILQLASNLTGMTANAFF
jgi:hypothetical protein